MLCIDTFIMKDETISSTPLSSVSLSVSRVGELNIDDLVKKLKQEDIPIEESRSRKRIGFKYENELGYTRTQRSWVPLTSQFQEDSSEIISYTLVGRNVRLELDRYTEPVKGSNEEIELGIKGTIKVYGDQRKLQTIIGEVKKYCGQGIIDGVKRSLKAIKEVDENYVGVYSPPMIGSDRNDCDIMID